MKLRRIGALVVLALTAILEIGDFFGNVSTALSSEAFESSREALGIGSGHQWWRLAFLIPASAAIAVFAGLAIVGVLRSSPLGRFGWLAALALALMGLFHIVFTGLVARSEFGLVGVVFLALSALLRWLLAGTSYTQGPPTPAS